MNEHYLAYLSLLDELASKLDSLTELARQKTEAVRKDDLNALDQALKQEQVLALALRGLESKRAKQLEQLGLAGVPLSKLAASYPEDLQMKAKKTAENLKTQYEIFCSANEVARNTLECNLHEIEKVLAGTGSAGIGYTSSEVDLPKPLKTDFRA